MSQSEPVLPTTLSVPIYCRAAFDMGEATSYAAAKRGDVPTIKIGGLLKVPVRVALAKMAGGDQEVLRALTADFAAKLSQLMAQQAA
jgi:hypothetical protein